MYGPELMFVLIETLKEFYVFMHRQLQNVKNGIIYTNNFFLQLYFFVLNKLMEFGIDGSVDKTDGTD